MAVSPINSVGGEYNVMTILQRIVVKWVLVLVAECPFSRDLLQ